MKHHHFDHLLRFAGILLLTPWIGVLLDESDCLLCERLEAAAVILYNRSHWAIYPVPLQFCNTQTNLGVSDSAHSARHRKQP